jgi:hypothetical protein
MVLLLVPAWIAACRSPNVVMVRRVPRDGPGYGAAVAVNRPLRGSLPSITAAVVGSLGCALTRLGQDEREQPRALLAVSLLPKKKRPGGRCQRKVGRVKGGMIDRQAINREA